MKNSEEGLKRNPRPTDVYYCPLNNLKNYFIIDCM